ncbi:MULTISPECIES: aspartyl-phosphate phosphatase Spo0E family protein [unclassified Bacillus (in: firmicutes)]|uniref:aspartyl-phosphate phosphatase Spo0E family protein n=1 Tax=unclassified Bacillus (in: firmicutes) TaxID=185979 RepID=UPI0009E4ED13|nr:MULTISPECIES: aspartyl-phosphate phosphatase Spo0E family protein [unclassified Bacillus (in: firmicutes)]
MDSKLLHDKIETRKEELIRLVIKYGLSHKKVIDFSQELDFLIYKVLNKSQSIKKGSF